LVTQESLADIGISIYQLKSLMILGSPEAIALSVQEGLGVGFVSKVVVKKLVAEKVKLINVKGLKIFQAVFVGRNVSRPPTAAQEAFWDFMQDQENVVHSLFK